MVANFAPMVGVEGGGGVERNLTLHKMHGLDVVSAMVKLGNDEVRIVLYAS